MTVLKVQQQEATRRCEQVEPSFAYVQSHVFGGPRGKGITLPQYDLA